MRASRAAQPRVCYVLGDRVAPCARRVREATGEAMHGWALCLRVGSSSPLHVSAWA